MEKGSTTCRGCKHLCQQSHDTATCMRYRETFQTYQNDVLEVMHKMLRCEVTNETLTNSGDKR